ncbi:MAG TPA: hypothetical protein EYO58_07985, partial [Flavobacteriales bacterium]|nr:hypothetical protein [Flavobacteriales bacterium]
MKLDARPKQILKIVIDLYIATAKAVGSQAVAKQSHDLNLSSATIRATMAALEHMGLLTQPHTSAGRIPTDKGLRVYLNDVMSPKLRPHDRNHLRSLTLPNTPDSLSRELGQTLALLSGQMSVIAIPRFLGRVLREIGISRCGSRPMCSRAAMVARMVAE